MKIVAINGSPKGEASNSTDVIKLIKGMMDQSIEWSVVSQIREYRQSDEATLERMAAADALLLAFPLYVDGIPGSLMQLLSRYEAFRARTGARPQRVCAVANCGFHEGTQNATALKLVAHWCESAGLDWRGGVGIGTGEMIKALANVPSEAGIRKPVIGALRQVADALSAEDGRIDRPTFTQHAFPWTLYKLAGELGWRQQAKANGLKPRDLFARPLESR